MVTQSLHDTEPEFSLLDQTNALQKQFSANEETSVVLQT